MYLLYVGLFSLVFLPHGVFPKEVKNGEDQLITCDPRQQLGVFWFRLQNNAKFQFLAYLSKTTKKTEHTEFTPYANKENTLQLKSFDKARDSGLYTCVSVNKNMLYFGDVIQLHGEPDPTPKPKPILKLITTAAEPTVTLCVRNINEVKQTPVNLGCEFHILVPLAAGCGLLLILQVITIVYCNRIRTRRCPHHYKRQPRNRPTGHNTLPNQAF